MLVCFNAIRNIMNHKGSQVPRLISIQGDIGEDGEQPLYRHPADEQPELVSWTHMAHLCRDLVSDCLGQQPLNHALIQKYRSGRDNIGEHSDKTLDILIGVYVCVSVYVLQFTEVMYRINERYILFIDDAFQLSPYDNK